MPRTMATHFIKDIMAVSLVLAKTANRPCLFDLDWYDCDVVVQCAVHTGWFDTSVLHGCGIDTDLIPTGGHAVDVWPKLVGQWVFKHCRRRLSGRRRLGED